MRTVVRIAMDPGAIKSGLGDHRDRATGCEADVGSRCTEKQSATRRLRTTITQVDNDSRTDVWRDRHLRLLPALGADEHLAGSPVDVIQGEACDFAGPHAELRQYHENSVVPPSQSGRSIATVEDRLNLRSREIGGQVRELPSPNRRHAVSQSERVQAFVMKISEK
jgi:hypothetical protein